MSKERKTQYLEVDGTELVVEETKDKQSVYLCIKDANNQASITLTSRDIMDLKLMLDRVDIRYPVEPAAYEPQHPEHTAPSPWQREPNSTSKPKFPSCARDSTGAPFLTASEAAEARAEGW